jgi:hypothetical protein
VVVEYKQLTQEQMQVAREALSEHNWSIAYGALDRFMILSGIVFVFTGRWISSIAATILANVTFAIGQIKHDRAHKVLDEL